MKLYLYILLFTALNAFRCHAGEKEMPGHLGNLKDSTGVADTVSNTRAAYQFPPAIDPKVIGRPHWIKRKNYGDIVKDPGLVKHSLKRSSKYKLQQMRRAISETDTTIREYWVFENLADPAEEKSGSWTSEHVYIIDADKNGEDDVMFYYYRAADDAAMLLFTQHNGRYRVYKGGGYLAGLEVDSAGRLSRLVQYHYACCMYDRDHVTEAHFEYGDSIMIEEKMWTLLIHANDTLPSSLSFQSLFIVSDSLYMQGSIGEKQGIKKGVGYHGSYLLNPGDRGAIYGSVVNSKGEKWAFVIADPLKRGRYEEGHFCGWVREEDVELVSGF